MKMKNLITPFIISFLLAATTSLAAESLILSDKSYGLVTFGGKLKAIEKKVGEKAKGETGDKGCDFVIFKKYPEIKFMVEDGIVTRADALSPQIQNKLQIRIGTSIEEVKRRYPAVEVKPHKYDDTGHYLIFKSKDGKRAILFEEGSGKVTDTRSGIEPSVEYVEGCL
ncbi:MAG: hypothetical protein WC613_06315 [Candidatus Aenigmatarchaeota archaeon]